MSKVPDPTPADDPDAAENPYQAPAANVAPILAANAAGTIPVVPWRWPHVVLVGVLCLGGSLVGTGVAALALGIRSPKLAELLPEQWQLLILAGALGSLAGMAISIAWLRGVLGANWTELGWRSPTWSRDVQLGLVNFLILMIPIFGMQYLLNVLYERLVGPPPQHPLIEHLLEHPGGGAFLVTAFTAIIAAPLTEEFLFRAVLQGWLQRLALEWHVDQRPSLYQPPTPDDFASAPANRPPLLVWPIIVSSAFFAAAHWSHGVAWVPLFFLALALGYLYQRTGNLLASITLHMCLNGFSTAMLYLATSASA